METKDVVTAVISVLALVVSVFALVLTIQQRRRERLDAYIGNLLGDRRSVTNAAITIRLSRLLRNDGYRRSLIASLLLAWNFETSDRARAAVLAALVEAKRAYPGDYRAVVADLTEMNTDYERVVPSGDISRGQGRLNDVTAAVETASASR
jgi:hypothetical protein